MCIRDRLGDDEKEVTEAQKKLRENKLLELPEDAKAEYLTRQMDENGAEVLRKAIKEDIYNFSHVPNFMDENFAGNVSGVAMEYKLLGLEMITKVKDCLLYTSFVKRILCNCTKLILLERRRDMTIKDSEDLKAQREDIKEMISLMKQLNSNERREVKGILIGFNLAKLTA